jgi:CheY-like chemotaxis protein
LNKKQGEPDYQELQEINSAARKGGELIKQLLTFSRKVESRLRPINVNQELEQARRLLHRTIPKMIAIELHQCGNLWTVSADPTQLEQIIVNLALNAKDAMADGGKLIIETENAVLDEEYCRKHVGARPGDYVLLRISDTGEGMDEETLEHVFEPFYTTKGVGEGTGLGLAMVYGIVKNHGGYIWCSSEIGGGTTFEIYLPAIERQIENSRKELEEKLQGGTEKILLVDDDKYIQDLGKQILTRFGYTVFTATDGESALSIYHKEKDHIDLVILDLIMPGMGGKRCLDELVKLDPHVKVLIASGYISDGSTKEKLKNGATDFISKPYEMRRMLQVVRETLNSDLSAK